ncbi:MAG: glycosyltransferase family 2 protein [Desulfobaccales bacterium]
MKRRLVIISPCRDEEQFVKVTLDSVIKQTYPPDLWIIVDDGSQDRTAEIIEPYAAQHPWIRLVRRERRGSRQLGPGVVSAFNAGLAALGDEPFDVIGKLDSDTEFGSETLAAVMAHFDDPMVGMASGNTYLLVGHKLVFELYTSYHVPGNAKFYRRECFRDIGGLQPVYGWDVIDETDARRHGWVTLSDPKIIFIHHRMQGSSFGATQGRVIWGRCAYAIGSHPLFALARGFYRMAQRPRLVGGLAFIWGFISSYFNPNIQRLTDPELIQYLREEQLYRLTHGNRLPPAAQHVAGRSCVF